MVLTAHAYLVEGDKDAIEPLAAYLEKEGVIKKGSPDIFSRSFSAFSIEDARSLRESASLRAMSGEGRVFIIAAPTIPPDAQNTLLKIIEEPPLGTRFFLIVPSPELLLPTLRSRMQSLKLEYQKEQSVVDAKLFLKATPESRLALLKPFLEKGEDDKRDLSGAILFLGELERVLSTHPGKNSQGIKAVYRARKYITDRGALAKVLLEQTAYTIPKML